jgi:hypothetical protein
MKKIWLLTVLIFISLTNASVSRLYIGELDGQFMAGVDTRIDFSAFYVGGDVRTIIRKTVFNSEEEETVGFLPDRTDYKTFVGIKFGEYTELEYAHTCYHRVISNDDLSFYKENKNLGNTDSLAIRQYF